MAGVVISYRRADSAAIAGRVADNLVMHFGQGLVFMDIDSIPLGKNFGDQINETLNRCDVVLAIIGPRWLRGADDEPRLMGGQDWVRLEIETAIAKKIPIIPVLIDGTKMPSRDALPKSMQELAYFNAATLDSGVDFHHHVERLVHALDGYVKREAGISKRKTRIRSTDRPAGNKESDISVADSPETRRLQVVLAVTVSIVASVLTVLLCFFLMAYTKTIPGDALLLSVIPYLVSAVSIYRFNYVLGGLETWSHPVAFVLFRALARTIEALCWLVGILCVFWVIVFGIALGTGTHVSSGAVSVFVGSVVVSPLTVMAAIYLFLYKWQWSWWFRVVRSTRTRQAEQHEARGAA